MPTETMIIVAIICALFAFFAVVVAFADATWNSKPRR